MRHPASSSRGTHLPKSVDFSITNFALLQWPLASLLLLGMLLFSYTSNGQQLLINEFMASNGTTIVDEFGVADDWIELYNPGNSPVNVGGYFITDDLLELNQWQIPTTDAALTTIPANGYLLLWADKETEQGVLHVNIKLGSGGEDLALVQPDGITIVDSYTFGVQALDISEGRTPNGGSNFDFFAEPTPNGPNNTIPGVSTVEPVAFSVQGGIYTSSRTVDLSTATADADIHYTMDGREPTINDPIYQNPLTIDANTPLRAKAFSPPLVASPVTTQTYLFNISHNFAVIAYSADPDELFDPVIGIYPNFLEDIEIVVNAELYETDNTQGFNQLVESEIQGTGSATNAQKSLALKAKSSLGSAIIPYQVFPDMDLVEYRSLTLRNNGQDWNITHFRDAMVTSLVRNVQDINNTIESPIIYGQAHRPGIVYINGVYWGMHNIRERMDKRYLKNRFDLDETEIDFLENQSEVREGDFTEWDAFENLYETGSLSSPTNFAPVAEKLELDHYRDYIVFNVFVDNYDWPGNNNRRWKKRNSDEQWRWMSWDLDFSFGLFSPGQPFNSGYFGANALSRLQNPNAFNWPNPQWATSLFNNLLENPTWRYGFINRMADQLNILYTPTRMNARISEFENTYAPEVQQHHDRWSSGYQIWSQHVQKLRNFANGRPDVVKQNFIDGFSEINGTAGVTVNLNPVNRGEVAFSTINVKTGNEPFNGTYFTGVPIPVQAFPNRGYVLNSWSGALSGDDPTESITILGGNQNITANFVKGSTSTQSIVINEINYNSPDSPNPNPNDWVELYNPNNGSVDISGWYFEDEGGNFFGLPKNTTIPGDGYLVLAEDLISFGTVYPNVTNVIGSFGATSRGFGLSGGGELITLKNSDGVLIDEVDYDDKSPWPTAPDGDGPTLQLITPSLDNALASSWKGTPATPGISNGNAPGPQDQTISFGIIDDKNIDALPFGITAMASSGLPVSFSIVSGPATINGNLITLNGMEGTVTVQATQGGNAQWNPATSVNRSFAVISIPTNGDCDDITWTTTSNSVSLDNISSGNYIIKLFGTNYNTVFDCTNCPVPLTVESLEDEVHHLDVQLYTANWQAICTLKEDILLDGGPQPSSISLNCPNDLIIQIPTGSNSVAVNYNVPTATTTCATAGLVLNRTGGPISGSALTAGTYIVNYAATDDCNNNEVCSFNITVQAPDNPPTGNYCNAQGQQPWQEWMALVNLGTINNASGKCASGICGYANFTNLSTDLVRGETVDIQLTPGLSWSGYNPNLFWRVWIDWNQDGDFSDAGEQVVEMNNGNQPVISSIVIPGTANLGTTRMRIAMKKDTYANACEIFTKGEVEDYSVNLVGDIVTPPMGDYCEAQGNRPWQEWIAGVALNEINQTSDKCAEICGYSDFTDQVATVAAGGTYSLDLTPGLSWSGYRPNLNWRVWIDFNGDGDFLDADEMVFQQTDNNGPGVINGNVTIPLTASAETTRMRISLKKDGFASSCETFQQGEVEDYTINITAGSSNLLVSPGQDLLFLRGQLTPSGVQLNWVTNTEFKNNYFVLEQSTNGVDFVEADELASYGLETTATTQYQWLDLATRRGQLYYRVRAVYTTGAFGYSNIIEFNNGKITADLIAYPNPATDQVWVDLSQYAGAAAELVIANALGIEVLSQDVEELSANPLRLSVVDFRAGSYVLTVKVEGRKRMSRVLVVTRL